MKTHIDYNLFLFSIILTCCLTLSAQLFCGGSGKQKSKQTKEWTQVPLCAAKQKEAGLIGGEGMQMIWGISYAPSNHRIVYIVSDTSQVWKSIDGGISWQMKHKGFLANGGISLVIDPKNENIVFVAGSKCEWDESSDSLADGIYRTKDGGENWELVRQTCFSRLMESKGGVNFAFGKAAAIYAGTHTEGLLKSTDGGDTWSSLDILSSIRILDLKASPQDQSILFIAAENGLYKFIDETSAILTQIGTGLPDFPRAIAIPSDNSDIIYITVGKSGVWKSIDGGNNFFECNNGLEATLGVNHATYLAISPVDPEYLYVSFYLLGGNHPYYSHDGGNSWYAPSIMDDGSLIYDVNNDKGGEYWGAPIAPSPVDKNIALTSGAGNHIERTLDGGNIWAYSGDGYTGGRAGNGSTSFSWDPNNPNRFAIFLIDFGALLTEDGGSTFRNLKVKPGYNDGLTTPVGALDPTADSKVIVTAVGDWEKQTIAVTRDEGETWELISGTDSDHKYIAFHPQKTDIIYAGKYKSIDKGNRWDEISKSIAAIFPANGDIVYALEVVADRSTIYKSIDGGVAWTQPYDDLYNSAVQEIAIDPSDQDRIYLATLIDGIFIWNGSKWLKRTEADGFTRDRFETLDTACIVVDPDHPNIIYAGRWIAYRGHANGIFRSTDYGETWKNITYNLGPEFTTWSISVNPYDGYVYIGSSHGTWKFPNNNSQ
ncbi:MAG: hypothetical protein SVR08_01255 [Spirochaetota bacterium]|nr:hypothetical protein [Spirochaetota bacterium]